MVVGAEVYFIFFSLSLFGLLNCLFDLFGSQALLLSNFNSLSIAVVENQIVVVPTKFNTNYYQIK
jgi:hypothetical protein